ncbi:uncharacterized protein [Amphiura filiformis]|uniref:uncharacterized protein isoform X1 n=1 Tax=Amphiura filiformis TaxID=82378 RepID=UPI003B20C7BD
MSTAFLRAKAMKRHLETKHKPVHTCKICNKSSTLANFLEKHAKTHERRDTLYQCTELYCLVQCKTKKDFQRHQMIHTGYKPYVCETCGKGYIRPSDLKAHKRTHTGDYIHCTLCDTFRTNRNTTLRKHMREHHGNKPVERKPIVRNHMCELCGLALATNAALKKHRVSVHTREKLYHCNQCDYTTTHKNNVQSHIKMVHEKLKPYKCQFCEKFFALPKTRNEHQRIHTGEKPYTCEFCGKAFSRADGLRSHRKLHVADFKFECDVCGYKTIRSKSLKQHKEKNHSGETLTFNCTKCNMSFCTAQTLNAHNKEHKDGVEYVAKKEYQCTECDFSADNQRALQQHVKHCHSANPEAPQFECGYCHKRFNSKASCENHVEKSHERYFRPIVSQGDTETITNTSNPTVTAIPNTTSDITAEAISSIQVVPTSASATERKPIVKNHMCELCGVACSTNAALRNHRVSVHTKAKLYSCDQCDYVTSHRGNVPTHINAVHKKLKPHKCQFCEKSFALMKTRNDHQRIHTGEKPFVCDFCGKGFGRADGLKSHRKLHVADFKFECDVCGYKTVRSQSLKQHKEKHHSGETLTFNCTKCNMSFSTAQTLNAHNKEHKDGVEYVAKKEHQCTECDFSADNQRALQKHVKNCHTADPEAPQFECGYCHKKFNSKLLCENHVEKSHERYFRPAISQGERETITTSSNPTVTAIPIKIYASTTSDITAEAVSSIIVPQVLPDKSAGQVVPTSAPATVIPAGEEEVAAAAAVLGMLPGGYPPGSGQVAIVSSEVTVPFSK